MKLLQIIQTIPPDQAKLIDSILSADIFNASRYNMGDGSANRDGPDRWDVNKLMRAPISTLREIYNDLLLRKIEKPSCYTDFSGEFSKNSDQ